MLDPESAAPRLNSHRHFFVKTARALKEQRLCGTIELDRDTHSKGCDLIVSWNFKHIVNVKTIRGIKVITTVEGYKELLIYPPTALLNEEE